MECAKSDVNLTDISNNHIGDIFVSCVGSKCTLIE